MKGVAAIVGEEVGLGSQVGIGNADGVVLYPVNDTLVNFGYVISFARLPILLISIQVLPLGGRRLASLATSRTNVDQS